MSRRLSLLAVLAVVSLGTAAAAADACTTPASLSIAPQSFFFCCTHPSTATYTVTNDGGRSTGKLKVTLAGLGAENFKISKNRCRNRSLAPTAACTFDVTWLPGSDSSPTLTVASRTVSLQVQLYGTAVP